MRLHVPQSPDENRTIAASAAKLLNVTFAEPFMALAVVDARGVLIGAVVLNNYDGFNVDLSGVGEGAFTPTIVRALARYVFNDLGCCRVTLKTRRSNRQARKLLGRHFKFETSLRMGFGTEDGLQFRMCRDECPWLEQINGQHSVAPAAA